MSLCDSCHENVAIIYTSKMIDYKPEYTGYCMSCALHKPELGMRKMIENSGVTEANVDEVTEQLNTMMEPMRDDPPEVLMEKVHEIMQNIDPQQLMGSMNEMMKTIKGKDDSASDADEDETEHDNVSTTDGEQIPGLAIGEQSISEALQMMISGMMGSSDLEKAGLMPAARGAESESPAGRGNDEKTTTRQDRNKRDNKRNRKFLDTYGTNLTDKARRGEMDPIIGRDKELERVVQILNRRSKNNPVLLGEPGVGKTAIAEGLALRIAEEKVPAKLLNMEVYLLDMTGMVAGTQFRGQFESRMKGLVDESKALGNIILVIDELHNIMGAGDAEGAMNAANILKPSLAKGEVRVLGSTTLDEYRRFIEKDSALERRFQQVIVEEPNAEDTFSILKGLKGHFEKHHHIEISDDVISYSIELADRYVSGRFFPDKAIDIIDEAGSAVNLKDLALVRHEQLKQELEIERENYKEIENTLDTSLDQNEVFERQAKHKSQLMRLEEDFSESERSMRVPKLTKEDIAAVVELWTGIPLKRISEGDSEKLLNLETRIHERVIGQDTAVKLLSQAIRRNRAGLGKRRKPASFIFVGPTGVGKTELVKSLAAALFDNEEALVRFDMSEFMEAHTVSKLIGSPPGYVGYDDAGQLTEKIRRHPYSVILLDEIEKAHVDVFNILLQILDDGRLTDSHGRTVNFEHSVIIMTSNVGTSRKGSGIGFGKQGQEAIESQVNSALKDIFRPEFLNRVDDIVVFETLKPEEIRQIVDLMVKEVETSMASKGLKLVLTDAVKDALAKEGYDEKYGARPLRKVIQKRIENPLADKLLAGELEDKIGVAFDYVDGEFELSSI